MNGEYHPYPKGSYFSKSKDYNLRGFEFSLRKKIFVKEENVLRKLSPYNFKP